MINVLESSIERSGIVKVRPRSVGRPQLHHGPNGRAKLLAKTRELLKLKPRVNLQRQEIAKFAGVTPALVSYYFPDKWDLIEAAAATVIEEHVNDVMSIVTDAEPDAEHIHRLAFVYVSFILHNGHMLDFFLENITSWKRQERLAQFVDLHKAVAAFFSRLMQQKILEARDSTIFRILLWSTAHSIAQHHLKSTAFCEQHPPSAIAALAETVFVHFMGGAGGPPGQPPGLSIAEAHP